MSSYRMKYKIGATQYHIPVVDDMAGFGGGVPLGTILPYSANSEYPPEGFLFCDGSAVSRSAYPDLFALIGTTYGSGDGVSTFNLPDLGFVDAKNSSVELSGMAHVWVDTNLRNQEIPSNATHMITWNGSNAMYIDSRTDLGTYPFADLGSSLASAELADTTTAIRYIIKAFSATSSNSELVDVTQLSTEITKKADYRTDFCYVYPNNGTAENPANVSLNSTYVVSNPFSGYVVRCSAELYCWDEWVEAPFVYHFWSNDHRTVGLISLQNVANDCILVITGTNGMVTGKSNVNIFPNSCLVADRGSSNISTPLPCRIKVWKIGKIPNQSP